MGVVVFYFRIFIILIFGFIDGGFIGLLLWIAFVKNVLGALATLTKSYISM